jgi:hypothetical protein
MCIWYWISEKKWHFCTHSKLWIHRYKNCRARDRPFANLKDARVFETKDFVVKTLGAGRVDSPLAPLLSVRKSSIHNVEETDRVLLDDIASAAIARGGGTLLKKRPLRAWKSSMLNPSGNVCLI